MENIVNFIRGKFLLPLSDKLGRNKRIADGYILYKNDKIIEVGEYNEQIGEKILKTYENIYVLGLPQKYAKNIKDLICLNGVILPGFIKAHGHDHESPIIGIVKDVPLTKWLDGAVNMFTKLMEEETHRLKEYLGISPHFITYLKARLDDIYYGITSCMVHHCGYNKYHVEEIVEANKKAGTRMIIAVGSQDRNYYEKVLDKKPEEVIKRLEKYREQFKNVKNIEIIPGPDQFFSNGPELLKALKDWSRKNNTLIHIHSSEEYNTTQWFKKKYGMTPIEYGESIGFLDENTILAHQVHCTEKDLEIIQKTKAKVVHNPLANTILGSGMPPIIEMLKRGIKVVISTDGSGSADNQNILNAARLASQYQKAYHKDATLLNAQQVLEMITIEPAQMLRINAGSLEPGKSADIIVIDLNRPNLTPTKISNVVENLIWASDGSEVQYVISQGKILKDDYRFKTLDKEYILKKITLLSEELDKYKEKIGELKGTGIHQ